MSRPRPDLINTTKAAQQYVEWLGSLTAVKQVLLQGSRSPLRDKKPSGESDWDFVIVSDVENFKIIRPRDAKQLHSDIVIISTEKIGLIRKAVEVYPNDNHGVFSDDMG